MTENKKYMADVAYPDEKAQRAQIQMILEKSMPAEKTFFERLKETYVGPGLSVIFYNGKFVVAGSMVIYGILCFLTRRMEQHVQYEEYLALMMFPLLHLIFYSLSYWAEEQSDILELKHSLRYSFTYIISLRMFYISILSAVMNIVLVLGMFQLEYIWKIGLIGFSSMFLFATLTVFVCEYGGNYSHILAVAALWGGLCLLLARYGARCAYILFEILPVAVHVIMAVICFVGFISYMRKVENANAYTYEYQ